MRTNNDVNLNTDHLHHIAGFLAPADRGALAATSTTMYKDLFGGREQVRRLVKSGVGKAVATFVREASSIEDGTSSAPYRRPNMTRGQRFVRGATYGADAMLKKVLDSERSVWCRGICAGALVGAVTTAALFNVYTLFGGFEAALSDDALAKSRGSVMQRDRHDKRRAVRQKTNELCASLRQLPACITPDDLRELTAPAVSYLVGAGAHDRLRMRSPEKALKALY